MDYKLPTPAVYLAMSESQLRTEITKINCEISKVESLLKTSPEEREALINRLALLRTIRGKMCDRLESSQ